MASYSGKLRLSVCFPFKLLLRKVFICLNVSQINETTSKSVNQRPVVSYSSRISACVRSY